VPGIPQEVYGPVGALALAIVVIGGLVRLAQILWKEHLKSDQDDRDQRDKALEQVDATVGLLKLSAEGNKAMADAWDRKTKADGARKRREDG